MCLCIAFRFLDLEILNEINEQLGYEIKHSSSGDKVNDDEGDFEMKEDDEIEIFHTMGEAQYHDDNFSLRKIEHQLIYFDLFIKKGPEYGMIINKTKSKLIVKNKSNLTKYEEKIKKLFPNDDKICENGDFESLGIPIGSNEYKNEWIFK